MKRSRLRVAGSSSLSGAPDLDVSVLDLGFEFKPRFAVRDPDDESRFFMLGEVLIAARDWTLEYAMPFFDWLTTQPSPVEPVREGTGTGQHGSYEIAPPGGSRPAYSNRAGQD